MYRRQSVFNSLLLTERCNSYCIMCSQPPRANEDQSLIRARLDAIPLMNPETKELGLTGGEPTLLGDTFFQLVERCQMHLPSTALHVLSNGRMFCYLSFAQRLAAIGHKDLMIGIPLYSDLAWQHELVVQAEGSFDQTVRGILNLARCRVPVEIRVVIHRHTIERLPQLASYISRNLPFAAHVALMGFEPIGFGKTNLGALWTDPIDYQDELAHAVGILVEHGMNISIYNHQLCVLPEALWPWTKRSISDWKNIYLDQCSPCSVKGRCGGFFHSAVNACSRAISPIRKTVASSLTIPSV